MNDESKVFGMSVRAFIALLMTVFVCAMAGLIIDIPPTLHDAFFLVIGFYFGQKSNTGGSNEIPK